MRQLYNSPLDYGFSLHHFGHLTLAALHGAGVAIVMEDLVAPFIADGRLVRVLECYVTAGVPAAKILISSVSPLRVCMPRSSKLRPEPATRSLTTLEVRTSPAPAS